VPVEFQDIAEVLAAHGLQVPNLNVLVPNALPYEVLAIQPGGAMQFRETFVGNENRELAVQKFSNFFHLAVQTQADLVLSPEYACPWNSLEAILHNGLAPALGKLWALGCESITPAELAALKLRVPEPIWICETPQIGAGNFLDPICYVFKTNALTSEEKLVVVVQFKTLPMGGGETFERDNMICGTRRYFLRNRDHDHLRFYSLICSEALEFQIDHARAVEFSQHPSIIFHPQMINDARHSDIRKYRSDLFREACSDNLEVICLNWARELKTAEAPPESPLSKRGNSAIFMKSRRFDRGDNAIKSNHALGLYYSLWKERETDLCILNFEEHVFHFTNQKVYFVGPAVQSRRTGPTIRQLLNWDLHQNSWQVAAKADDGFHGLCQTYGSPKLEMCVSEDNAPVDRERLLTLSAGTLEASPDWHKIEKLRCFIAETDERSKRLTFVHECALASIDYRNDHLVKFIKLQTLFLERDDRYPPPIEDLRGNYQITIPHETNGFRFNVVNRQTGKNGATAIFLGTQPRSKAREFFDLLCKAWAGHDDRFKEELVRRIVVAYEEVDGSVNSMHSGKPQITDSSEPPASILGEDMP
jgi:hypothetical protein